MTTETFASGYDATFPPFFRRISEEAVKPGHQHTGHAPNFPPVIHSRKITGNAEPLRNRFKTISRFDCKHFASAAKLTQRQTTRLLCKNCGRAQLLVDGQGKMVL
jgi:hypothetical protein